MSIIPLAKKGADEVGNTHGSSRPDTNSGKAEQVKHHPTNQEMPHMQTKVPHIWATKDHR